MSTNFDHEDIDKDTWIYPDGHKINQIDHVLIEATHVKVIKDSLSFNQINQNGNSINLKVIKLKAAVVIYYRIRN